MWARAVSLFCGMSLTKAEIVEQIVAKGAQLRSERESASSDGAATLQQLLDLKAQFKALTGAEYRARSSKSAKRARASAAAQREAESNRVDPSNPDAPSKRRKQPGVSQMWREEARAQREQQSESLMALPPPPSSFPAWSKRDYFRFELLYTSKKPGSRARVGRIHTPHGVIDTPGFVPVGTNAALKAIDERQAHECGVQLMFCNTYHLLVHPGPQIVRDAGGLHKYMNHRGPIITDSGGFQVFSLAAPSADDAPEMKSRAKAARAANREGGPANSSSLLCVGERGALFRSYLNGEHIELTPESSVAAQKDLASDIIIPLDELPPYHISRERLKQSVRLSHRWMARSLRAHLERPQQQAMYAVIHGGTDEELRKESAEYLSSLPFDGFAVGGSLGKDRAEMLELLRFLMPLLPTDKPNHLLGIADPESAEAVVPFGVDTMDSCNPTRIARHGLLLCTGGNLKIQQSKHINDYGPIDPQVETIAHSRAYLHHLYKQHEPLYSSLATMHNLIYMNKHMASIRDRIMKDEI